jgi:Flp pilus assembly pilin Flp
VRERFGDSLVCRYRDEAGQGLIEYVLVLGLITFAAAAAMQSLVGGLSRAFSVLGSTLAQNIS